MAAKKKRLGTIWRLPDDLWAELVGLLPPPRAPGLPGRPQRCVHFFGARSSVEKLGEDGGYKVLRLTPMTPRRIGGDGEAITKNLSQPRDSLAL